MKSKILRVFAFAVLSVMMLGVADASAQSPIRWRTSVQMNSADEGVLTLRALVDEGWHLYGFELPEDGPRPTVVDLSPSTDVEFTGTLVPEREPIAVRDEMFGLDLQWWDADVCFTVPFRVTGDSPAVKGTISFMACNDQTCQPPRTVQIMLPVLEAKAK